jgi:hypothetical protein
MSSAKKEEPESLAVELSRSHPSLTDETEEEETKAKMSTEKGAEKEAEQEAGKDAEIVADTEVGQESGMEAGKEAVKAEAEMEAETQAKAESPTSPAFAHVDSLRAAAGPAEAAATNVDLSNSYVPTEVPSLSEEAQPVDGAMIVSAQPWPQDSRNGKDSMFLDVSIQVRASAAAHVASEAADGGAPGAARADGRRDHRTVMLLRPSQCLGGNEAQRGTGQPSRAYPGEDGAGPGGPGGDP